MFFSHLDNQVNCLYAWEFLFKNDCSYTVSYANYYRLNYSLNDYNCIIGFSGFSSD